MKTALLLASTIFGTVAMSSPLLDALAMQLRQLRALPMAAPSKTMCPAKIESLVGLGQERIGDALGKPDFVDASTGKWVYFFTSPIPPGQRGGGFPELVFIFGSDRAVLRVSCHYSR